MAEEKTEKTEETERPPATGDEQQHDEQLNEGGKRALDAERAARKRLEHELKELRPLAAKAKQADDAKKDEVQRLTEQLTATTTERDSAALHRDRLKVAISKGLTLTQAKRLVGSTEDELTADADELLADLGARPGGDKADERPGPSGKPREHLQPGGGDQAPPEETDVRALGKRMFNT